MWVRESLKKIALKSSANHKSDEAFIKFHRIWIYGITKAIFNLWNNFVFAAPETNYLRNILSICRYIIYKIIHLLYFVTDIEAEKCKWRFPQIIRTKTSLTLILVILIRYTILFT